MANQFERIVRVDVRTTELGRLYASSPDVPGLHAYASTPRELISQIRESLAVLAQLSGEEISAQPITDDIYTPDWTWSIAVSAIQSPTTACA